MIPKQLSDQFDVGGLAAAGTSAGKFKVGFGKLGGFDGLIADSILFDGDGFHAVFPVGRFFQLAFQRFHDQRLFFSRAYVGTAAASGAVIGGNLDTEIVFSKAGPHGFLGGKSFRSSCFFSFVQQDGANGSVRADQGTQVALDAVCHLPLGYIHGGAPFFVLGGASWPGTVFQTIFGHGGYGQGFPFLPVHNFHHFFNKGGSFIFFRGIAGGAPGSRDGNFM